MEISLSPEPFKQNEKYLMPRYLVTIEGKEFDISLEKSGDNFDITVDGKKHIGSVTSLTSERLILIYDNSPNEIEIRRNINGSGSTTSVFLDNHEFLGEAKEYRLAEMQKRMGIKSENQMGKILKSSMPGMVLEVKVSEGDKVTQGQPLLILEAMKMENVIKATGEGTIKKIFIESGKSVEKSDKLVEFE